MTRAEAHRILYGTGEAPELLDTLYHNHVSKDLNHLRYECEIDEHDGSKTWYLVHKHDDDAVIAKGTR